MPLGQKLNAQSFNPIIFIYYGPKLANMHKEINLHIRSQVKAFFWQMDPNYDFRWQIMPYLSQISNVNSQPKQVSHCTKWVWLQLMDSCKMNDVCCLFDILLAKCLNFPVSAFRVVIWPLSMVVLVTSLLEYSAFILRQS